MDGHECTGCNPEGCPSCECEKKNIKFPTPLNDLAVPDPQFDTQAQMQSEDSKKWSADRVSSHADSVDILTERMYKIYGKTSLSCRPLAITNATCQMLNNNVDINLIYDVVMSYNSLHCEPPYPEEEVKRIFESTLDIFMREKATSAMKGTTAKLQVPNIKPTNPKQALGIRKAPLHAVPCGPLLELGLSFMEGGCKYGTHNYRVIGVRYSTYYNAAMRHLMAWWEGEDIDPDSGLPHIMKAAACLFILRDSQMTGNDTDDRPIRTGFDMDYFNEHASHLVDQYPNPVEPFTEKGMGAQCQRKQ